MLRFFARRFSKDKVAKEIDKLDNSKLNENSRWMFML